MAVKLIFFDAGQGKVKPAQGDILIILGSSSE